MLKTGMIIAERYEILGKIGTGGMADVYKAKDHKLNRFVAVKVLKPEFREDTTFIRKFRSEAQAAAGLTHPNIVNVFDVGDDEGVYYIVMELIEGITLKEYIAKKGKLSIKEATSIAIQVSMGLEAAHNHGIVHWEKADTEGTYASYTNGSDYVNIYKYSLDDVKTGIAKCNDTYEACYQTIYSEGNSLYMAVGYAKDADDIGDVRKFVEYISYPGNPSLTREADENSDKSEPGTSGQKSGGETNSSDSDTEKNASVSSSDSSDDSDIRTTSPMTLVDSDGNTIEINYILHKDYSCEYRGDDGMEYTDNGDETYTDENGNTYTALNDDTHHLGHTLEQHNLQDADGNTVTVTETTNGDYYFRDDNGTGFTDNGDGTWSDENGNSYTEMN